MHYSNEVTTRLAWESLRLFKDFENLTGHPSGYVRTGYFLVVGEHDRPALEANVAIQKAIGVDTDVVSAKDVAEIAPVLAVREDEAFAYEPESGYADPYSVSTGFASRARDMGAALRQGNPIRSVEVKNGKVTAVTTNNERINTPIAVIAAGPWSGPLLTELGVQVPLTTIRHQIITLRRPERQVPEHPTIGDVVNGLSARPDVGNMTWIGAGEEEFVGLDDYNQGVDIAMVARTSTSLTARMPGMAHSLFRGGWSGLFTVTPDWHPILAQAGGIDGLYCAVGFSGHGFKLSPMVGVVMSELILDGQSTSVDVSMLGIDRFDAGRLLRSRYSMNVLA